MSIPAGSSLPHGPPRSAFTDYAVFIASLFVHGDSLRVSATRTRRTCSVSFVPSRRRFSNPLRPARAPRAPPRTPSRAPPLRASPPPSYPRARDRHRRGREVPPRVPARVRRDDAEDEGQERRGEILDDVRPLAAFRPALRPPPLGAHVAGQTGVPDDDAAVREGLVDDLARARGVDLGVALASAARPPPRRASRAVTRDRVRSRRGRRRPPPRASIRRHRAAAGAPGPRRGPGRSAPPRRTSDRARAPPTRRAAAVGAPESRDERGATRRETLETAVTETRHRVMVSRRRAAHARPTRGPRRVWRPSPPSGFVASAASPSRAAFARRRAPTMTRAPIVATAAAEPPPVPGPRLRLVRSLVARVDRFREERERRRDDIHVRNPDAGDFRPFQGVFDASRVAARLARRRLGRVRHRPRRRSGDERRDAERRVDGGERGAREVQQSADRRSGSRGEAKGLREGKRRARARGGRVRVLRRVREHAHRADADAPLDRRGGGARAKDRRGASASSPPPEPGAG